MSQLGNKVELAETDALPIDPARQSSDLQSKELSYTIQVDFIEIFSFEILLIIFEFLNSKDLQRVGWVNQKAYDVACTIQAKRFKPLLVDSVLWLYLPAIAQITPEVGFKDFVVTNTGLKLNDCELSNVSTVAGLCSSLFKEHQSSRDCIGIAFDDIGDKIASAKLLLQNRVRGSAQTPASFEEFMSLYSPEVSRSQLCRLWTVYADLDRSLSTMLLFFEVSLHTRELDPNFYFHIIQNMFENSLSRWLMGHNLVALNNYAPDMFGTIIRTAIELRGNNNVQAQLLFHKFEHFLSRVTEEDLLDSIKPATLLSDIQVFSNIITANYQLMLRKFTAKLILRMLPNRHFFLDRKQKLQKCNAKLASQILRNPILIAKLSHHDLVQVLGHINIKEVNSLIRDNNHLCVRLTFDIIKQWLDDDPFISQKIANSILTKRGMLPHLTADHLNFFELRLDDEYSVANFNFYGAYSRLRTIGDTGFLTLKNESEIKKDLNSLNSRFLYKAVCNNDSLSYLVITLHLNKFDNEDLIKFTENCLITSDRFPEPTRGIIDPPENNPRFRCLRMIVQALPPVLKSRADSFLSTQWLELGLIDVELGRLIAKEYSQKLDNNHLNRLARAYNADISVVEAVKKERERRNLARKAQDKKTQKEAAYKVETAWEQVKESAEHLRSRDDLDDEDVENFNGAINAAYLATQNPTQKTIRNLKNHAEKCQSKSSTAWIMLGVTLLGLATAIAGVLTIALSVSAVGFFAPTSIAGTLGGVALTEIGLSMLLTGLDEILFTPKLTCSS